MPVNQPSRSSSCCHLFKTSLLLSKSNWSVQQHLFFRLLNQPHKAVTKNMGQDLQCCPDVQGECSRLYPVISCTVYCDDSDHGVVSLALAWKQLRACPTALFECLCYLDRRLMRSRSVALHHGQGTVISCLIQSTVLMVPCMQPCLRLLSCSCCMQQSIFTARLLIACPADLDHISHDQSQDVHIFLPQRYHRWMPQQWGWNVAAGPCVMATACSEYFSFAKTGLPS